MVVGKYSLFLVYFELIIIFVKVISSTFHLSDVNVTWSEAMDNCTSEGGQLVDLSSYPLSRPEWVPLKVQRLRKVWVQGRFNSTYFVWIHGCSKIKDNPDVLSHTFGRSISLVSCTMFCGTTRPYIGLKGQQCFCLNAVHLERNEPDKCNLPCIGERNDSCGGFTHASIYKLADRYGLSFNTEDKGNCVYVSKTNIYHSDTSTTSTDSIVWGTEDCGAELDGFVCQTYDLEISGYRYPVYYAHGRKNWYKSRDFCSIALNMTIANINSVSQRLSTMRDNEKYWIGLYRRDYPEKAEHFCAAVTLGDKLLETREKCSYRNKFICQKDDVTPTPGNGVKGSNSYITMKLFVVALAAALHPRITLLIT